LNEAVKAGDLRAMVELGKCYSDPSYKETQNLNDAITLLQNAKENGYDGDEPDKLIPIIKGEISSGKSGCFIATKVYGSYNCSEVIELRIFRDRYLTQTWVGRVVVDVYYALSPMLIALFGNHRNAFIIIRYMIVDPVRFIGKLLKLY
jgi:hypothetical protein